MMLIADISQPVAGTGMETTALWFSGITSLVSTVALIKSWTRGDQKREITFAGVPVDKTEFDAQMESNNNTHAQLFSKIGGVERGVQATVDARDRDSAESRRKIHESIADIGERVSATEKCTEMIDRRITQMDTKLDRLIERRSS